MEIKTVEWIFLVSNLCKSTIGACSGPTAKYILLYFIYSNDVKYWLESCATDFLQ